AGIQPQHAQYIPVRLTADPYTAAVKVAGAADLIIGAGVPAGVNHVEALIDLSEAWTTEDMHPKLLAGPKPAAKLDIEEVVAQAAIRRGAIYLNHGARMRQRGEQHVAVSAGDA